MKKSYGNQNRWSAKVERADRLGQPVVGIDRKTASHSLVQALSQHATQSGMITKLGLLKSGKLTLRCVIDRGNQL